MKRDVMPIATVLLSVCGMLTLVPASGGHGALLGTAAVLLVAWSVVERRTAARIPRPIARAADVLIATSILGLSVTHFGMETTSLAALGHVLAVSQLARAFRRKSSRDLMVMNGTAVGQAALAAFLIRDPIFLPSLLAIIVLAVPASLRVAGMELTGGKNVRIFTARPRGSAGLRARVGVLLQPLMLSLVIVLTGVAFFVILPRGRRFVEKQARIPASDPTASAEVRAGSAVDRRTGGVTAFTDHVSLGDVGRIKEVLREAFSVHLSVGRKTVHTEEPLYFRGAVFDTFDGRHWQRTAEPPGGERWLTTGHLPAVIAVRRLEQRPGARLVRQRYRLRETYARALPSLGTVATVRLHEGLPRLLAVAGGTYLAPDVPDQVLEYEMSSMVSMVSDRAATVDPFSPGERARHLTLPPGTARLSLLSLEVAGDGTPLDQAARLTRWLRENCDYTLSFRPWPSGRPVHDFLFETRAGHCEYFATSLALMLRAVGVPSRLVAGYRGGQWIEHREDYFVRLSDAHAWVEARIPGRGWVRMDPTPADSGAMNVPESRVPGIAPDPGGMDLPEEIAELVTKFGPEEREETLAAAASAMDFVVREGFGLGRTPRPFPPPLTVLTGALLMTLLASRVFRGVRGTHRSSAIPHVARTTPPPPDAPFYETAVRTLGRAGLARRRNQSPREFLDATHSLRGDAVRPFRRITLTFEGIRYGRRPLTDDVHREMDRLNEELRARLTSMNGPGSV